MHIQRYKLRSIVSFQLNWSLQKFVKLVSTDSITTWRCNMYAVVVMSLNCVRFFALELHSMPGSSILHCLSPVGTPSLVGWWHSLAKSSLPPASFSSHWGWWGVKYCPLEPYFNNWSYWSCSCLIWHMGNILGPISELPIYYQLPMAATPFNQITPKFVLFSLILLSFSNCSENWLWVSKIISIVYI